MAKAKTRTSNYSNDISKLIEKLGTPKKRNGEAYYQAIRNQVKRELGLTVTEAEDRLAAVKLDGSALASYKYIDSRVAQQTIPYRSVKSGGGFFLGDQQKVIYYPYHGKDELEGKCNVWWRCANDSEL